MKGGFFAPVCWGGSMLLMVSHPRCFGQHGLIFVFFFLSSVLLTCFFLGPQLLCFSVLFVVFVAVFSRIMTLHSWSECSLTTVTPVHGLGPLVLSGVCTLRHHPGSLIHAG